MDRILIEGDSRQALKRLQVMKENSWKLSYAAVFFDNANFLITKYHPLSEGVHLILELEDETKIHIESANCGYPGAGPSNTVKILQLFGIDDEELMRLIFYNDGISFRVWKGFILYHTIDTSYLFYPPVRYSENEKGLCDKIREDRNVSVKIVDREVQIFNPQRTCWNGFLNLLSYMKQMEMEYYIGDNSPLECGLYLEKEFLADLHTEHDEMDITGIEHVNLLLEASNFRVVCFIDRACENEVIEAVYLALTGKRLFGSDSIEQKVIKKKKFKIKNLFVVWCKDVKEKYDRINIQDLRRIS